MRLLLTLVLATGFVAALAQDRMTTLGRDVEATPVRLEQAERFVRLGGETVTTSDLVIVSVEIGNLTPFLPRGAEPPLFVIDGAVAKEIVSPLLAGHAVLLAPAPPSGETLTVGLLPDGMGLASVRAMPKQAHRSDVSGLTEFRRVMPEAVEPLRYEGMQALRERLTATRGRIER